MRVEYKTDTGTITVYTNPELIRAFIMLMNAPRDVVVVASIGGKYMRGTPIQMLEELQKVILEEAKHNGFEGIEK